MQFKDLSDETLKRLGERIIRNAKARIMRQIPSRGNNPRPSGRDRLVRTNNLLDSFNLTWDKMPLGAYALNATYEDYGNYNLFGTKPHAINTRDQGFFGMRFFGYRDGRGTGKGLGRGAGIRPQGWLSLYGDKPVYEAIVEAELRLTFQTFLNNTISGFSKGSQTGNI
jgi:hypothetical protein